MSSSAPVRVAVIGAAPGGFGHRAHIPGILAADGVELLAVATAHEETARAAAERWGVPRWYGGVDALLADDDVDLVTVSVRPRTHQPLVLAAVAAGKAVYCEWPLALDTDEATGMAAAATQASVPTAVGLQGRWVPEMRYLRDLVAGGAIGRPLSFDVFQQLNRFEVPAAKAWLHDEEEASGALFVASAHVIDGVRFVLGEVESVAGLRATLWRDDRYADTGEPFEWTASDTVRYVARLESGVVGSVTASNITDPPLGYRLRVQGEEGWVAASAPGYFQFTPMTLTRGTAGGEVETVPVPAGLLDGVDLEPGHVGANVGRAVSAFAATASAGERFRPDFDDGVGLHGILDAVMRSSDEGVWARA